MAELPPAVTYSEFAELQDAHVAPEDLFEMLKSADWRQQFEGLNLVRVINKFQWDFLLALSFDILPTVVELTDSPRSSLSKNALTTLSELFIVPRAGAVDLVSRVVPVLLLKSQSEKSFLKKEAVAALNLVSLNCPCESLVQVLTAHCSHKSGNLADLSFNYLVKVLPHVPEVISFHACAGLVDSKRRPTMTGSINFLRKLENSENFHLMMESLDPQTYAQVTRALETRPSEQTNLRSVIQQAKATHEASIR